jgi:diaminohydroxyphosphoribosylaminopyrimidine deaminase/5-amino-6-(5-phosphoribosylamino)uracil reductase
MERSASGLAFDEMNGDPSAARDCALMRRGIANAENGWGQTAPNPMVGAVVVGDNDEIIAEAWHQVFGGAHAEAAALAIAGERARGATLYVTLEPCIHHGKTPPCVDAVLSAGIARVVIASRDPSPVAGGGVERLRQAEVEVTVGVESEAACELNAAFFNSFVSDRPWVTLKLALSADGALADPFGQRRWITGVEARREVHRMRAGVDAVAVGSGTVLADDPELTVRDAPVPRVQPTRVVFDSRLRTPPTAALVSGAQAVPTIIITGSGARRNPKELESLGVRIIEAGDLAEALRKLRLLGIQSLLVEGGAELAGSFLRQGMVDRIAIFRSPVALGAGATKAFAHAPDDLETTIAALPVISRRMYGEDTLITYAVRRVPCLPG